MKKPIQKTLAEHQVAEFYHQNFVDEQTQHFTSLLGRNGSGGIVVDVGGGCGFFAKRLMDETAFRVRVLEADPKSIESCRQIGVDAVRGDALTPEVRGDERIVVFNLILHHLVGATESQTRESQARALEAWRPHAKQIFVNEYIYESFVGNVSGRLIFEITASRVLSTIGKAVARVIPVLRANTFGVGVRFRAHREWCRLFDAAGYDVKRALTGNEERVSPFLRLLLIKQIRRDSFLLEPRIAPQA